MPCQKNFTVFAGSGTLSVFCPECLEQVTGPDGLVINLDTVARRITCVDILAVATYHNATHHPEE